MPRLFLRAAFIGVLLAGTALRLADLDARVVHGDEAVHFAKFNELWTTGVYRYDPHDFHGPTLYYLTLPIAWAADVMQPDGHGDWRDLAAWHFRLVPALAGVATILLLPLLRDGLGRLGVVLAAALIAFSPALSFYSRYYIQETLLAFLTLAAIIAGWRFAQSRRTGWLLALGARLGLMHATKETFILSVAAAGAALLATVPRRRMARWLRRSPRFRGGLVWAGALAVLTSVACFSTGFTYWRGPLDSIGTYWQYFERADGAGLHAHPWHYYLTTMLHVKHAGAPHWSEALLLLGGLLGAALSWLEERRLARFLAVYTLLLLGCYSAIPYKTPWCSVQILLPCALLAAIGFRRAFLLARPHPTLQTSVAAGVLIGVAHLAWQARQANFVYHTDDRNPWVYAHPTRGVTRLADFAQRLAATHADGDRMLVRVIAADPWPLPWYLRRLERVGYWESPPDDCDAPLVIVSEEAADAVAARLRGTYHNSHYGLRRDVALHVLVEQALWESFAAAER